MKPQEPSLKLPGRPGEDDVRMRIYDQIGRVHKQVVEAGHRARMAGQSMPVDPSLVLHCEQAIAFLAEEILRLGAILEKESDKGLGQDILLSEDE